MKQTKMKYFTIKQFVILLYLILTTIVYFLSKNQGNKGIAFMLFNGGDDGFFYWEHALNVFNGLKRSCTSIYPYIIGNVMKFFNLKSVYLIRVFNYIGFIFLVSFSIKLVNIQFAINNYNYNKKCLYNSKMILLVSFLCYPSLLVVLNISILRDVWIYLLYTISIFISIKLIFLKKNKLLYLVLLIFSVLLLGQFRLYAVFSFIMSVLIYVVYLKLKLFKNKKIVIFSFCGAFIIYYIFFKDFTIFGLSLRRALTYRLSSLMQYSGGSQMWINLDQSNLLIFIINYIHSYIGNMVGPLPWHIVGTSTVIFFLIETIPMTVIFIFIIKKKKLLTKVQKYILLHAFIWFSIIGFTNDNIGTASRLRIIGWILILNVWVVILIANKYNVKK